MLVLKMKSSSLGFGVVHVRPHIRNKIEPPPEENPVIEYQDTRAVSLISRLYLQFGIALASCVVIFNFFYLLIN